jgi:hypothetical protein
LGSHTLTSLSRLGNGVSGADNGRLFSPLREMRLRQGAAHHSEVEYFAPVGIVGLSDSKNKGMHPSGTSTFCPTRRLKTDAP